MRNSFSLLAAALGSAFLLSACDEKDHPLAPTESEVLLPAGNVFSFSTIDVPGATSTSPQGISREGDIVGAFRDAKGVHGFLLRARDGTFTTIDYPGAVLTEARGIHRDGTIVGTYRLPGESAVTFHGFRRTPQGEFVKADYPGHTSTMPQRILEDGTILGCRHGTDMMGSMRGVMIRPNGNSEAEAFASMHNGATPDLRRIAGLYTNTMAGSAGRTEGYVIDNGTFKPFMVPGSNLTAAWDVSRQGNVVGAYRDAANKFHGFVLMRDGYRPIDAPSATATRAFGINERGDVVGSFVDAGGATHGFLARRTGS